MVSIDDMGREAVREGLKSIRIVNVPAMAQRALGFEAGVLTMTAPWGMGAEALHRDGEIRELLMARL